MSLPLMLEQEARLLERYRAARWRYQMHRSSVKDPTTLAGLAYEVWHNQLDILDRSQWVALGELEKHIAKLCDERAGKT